MSSLERDLIRWENGELTLEEVESAHPEAGVRDLMQLHTRLSMLRAIPLPDVEKAWSMTLPRLEDPSRTEPARVAAPERFGRLRDWARRPLAASFAALVMSGGAAYAAGVEPVQRAVDKVLDRAREATDLGGSGESERGITGAPADPVESGSDEGDDASARGRERANEVRGQGKEKGPNHGRREFGRSHKKHKKHKKDKEKDNEGDRGKERAPGLTGEDPGAGSPPAHAGNTPATKPDKENAPPAPAPPANNGNGGNGSDNGTGAPSEEPAATVQSGGGAAPAPESDGPGNDDEAHGNGNGQTKDKGKP